VRPPNAASLTARFQQALEGVGHRIFYFSVAWCGSQKSVIDPPKAGEALTSDDCIVAGIKRVGIGLRLTGKREEGMYQRQVSKARRGFAGIAV
jgi:hypothetical protein